MGRQRQPEKPLILGRSGTQYVAIVTKLLSSYYGAHLVGSYCKESNISDKNWPRYSFIIIFDQNWVENVRRYQLKLVNSTFLLTQITFYVFMNFVVRQSHSSLVDNFVYPVLIIMYWIVTLFSKGLALGLGRGSCFLRSSYLSPTFRKSYRERRSLSNVYVLLPIKLNKVGTWLSSSIMFTKKNCCTRSA